MIKIPAFDETEFLEKRCAKSHIVNIPSSTVENFEAYCHLLEENNFTKKEANKTDVHIYAAYFCEECAVYVNYFYNTGELQIVTDEDTSYFSFEDKTRDKTASRQITQNQLEVYGLSYAIRLSDGRFIVIDGGCDIDIDAQRLYNCLKEQSPYEKPVIAAWIMSHPHSDHYHCFFAFYRSYKNEVEIEKFIFHFCSESDYENYPRLEKLQTSDGVTTRISEFLGLVEDSGAKVYTAHTGQVYKIGDAVCEVLSTLDDTAYRSNNVNAMSLVIRMTFGGQVILWCTDGNFSAANLPDRYRDYLKADIMQVPHHGFNSGDSEVMKKGYNYIRPQVCLLSASEYNAYNGLSLSKKSTTYLMGSADIEEMITGQETRVIPIPYTPHPFGRMIHKRKFETGRSNLGATSWIFTNLNTARKSDFEYTLTNVSGEDADVMIEMFFDNHHKTVLGIKVKAKHWTVKDICITNPKDVDGEGAPIGKFSLKSQGVPKRTPFAVRFLSDIPIVVSHKKHKAAYHSSEV